MSSPLKNVCEELIRVLDHKVAGLESIARKLEADTEERFTRAGVRGPAGPRTRGCGQAQPPRPRATAGVARPSSPRLHAQVNPVALLRRMKKLEK
jgi:hypothetical protein